MISEVPVTKRHQSVQHCTDEHLSAVMGWGQGTPLEIAPSNSELLEFFESGREDSVKCLQLLFFSPSLEDNVLLNCKYSAGPA